MKKFITITLILISSLSIYAQTWKAQKSGTTYQLNDVFFIDANTGWAVGDRTALKTTDGGTTWTPIGTWGFSLLTGCQFINDKVGFIAADYITKTTDGGQTWNYMPGTAYSGKFHFIDENTGWTFGGYDGATPNFGLIHKTTDGGKTWTDTKNDSTWSNFLGGQFVDANNGWAFTDYNGLLVNTKNGGATWTTQLQLPAGFKIKTLFMADKDNGWLFAESDRADRAYKTTDGGANWNIMTTGVAAEPRALYFINKNAGWAAGRGQGGGCIINTTDAGQTWTLTSLGTTSVMYGIFMLDANHGWAVGDKGAIYSYSGVGATGVENKTTKVSSFNLEQNYPNPFNPSTTINYSIPKSGMVNLTVYNILGNKVAVLVNEDQSAGEHSVNFNASNLSNGVYLYTLTSGNYTSTKKLVLMK